MGGRAFFTNGISKGYRLFGGSLKAEPSEHPHGRPVGSGLFQAAFGRFGFGTYFSAFAVCGVMIFRIAGTLNRITAAITVRMISGSI